MTEGRALGRLEKPLTLGGKRLKNRVVVPPMADFGATGRDGLVNERHISHYRAFAEGGAGLVIIEACAVSEMKETRGTIGLYDDRFIPGLSRLAEAARAKGAAALVQLLHSGLDIMPEKAIAEIPRERFLAYKADFVSAAVRCQKAGFDGVDLHAAHGFYLNQIVQTSGRDDEYGGSFENRVRILRELVGEIKAACGVGFVVGVRFGSDEKDELLAIAEAIEEAGGDLPDVSWGYGDGLPAPAGFGYSDTVYMASLVKERAGIPVIAVGDITSGERAESILQNGYGDMVAVGRGHLCDPAWAGKVLAGRPVNPCLHCRRCLWYVDGRKCPARRKAAK